MIARLTPVQIENLLKIVDRYVLHFVATNIGTKHLNDDDKRILADAGINLKTLKYTPTVEQAFRFGILSAALGDTKAKAMDYEQFRKFLQSKHFLPLDTREQQALDSLEFQAYSQIKGLGNKIRGNFTQILIEADKKQRAKYQDIIKQKAKQAIADRTSVKQMASEIGHATQDWARDLDRISDYILHDAHDAGRAAQIEKYEGADAKVYKRVFDQACDHCVAIYLTAGKGSQPRSFTIAQLQANGSNIGRKVANWKPVQGATHPFCRCQLELIPANSTWDATKQQFVVQYQSERAAEIGKKLASKGVIKISRS